MSWNQGAVRDIVAKRTGDLEKVKCPCGCSESIFMAQCHATTLMRVAYDSQEKVLLIACPRCGALVAKVKVAE